MVDIPKNPPQRAEKAPDSPEVEKARKKLAARMQQTDRKITPEALSKMDKLIKNYISRHNPERRKLEGKEVTLFDENRHPAPSSEAITKLASQLRSPAEDTPAKSLEGRVAG